MLSSKSESDEEVDDVGVEREDEEEGAEREPEVKGGREGKRR